MLQVYEHVEPSADATQLCTPLLTVAGAPQYVAIAVQAGVALQLPATAFSTLHVRLAEVPAEYPRLHV